MMTATNASAGLRGLEEKYLGIYYGGCWGSGCEFETIIAVVLCAGTIVVFEKGFSFPANRLFVSQLEVESDDPAWFTTDGVKHAGNIKCAMNYDEMIIKYNIIACLKPTMTYMQMHDQ